MDRNCIYCKPLAFKPLENGLKVRVYLINGMNSLPHRTSAIKSIRHKYELMIYLAFRKIVRLQVNENRTKSAASRN